MFCHVYQEKLTAAHRTGQLQFFGKDTSLTVSAGLILR
jgi:hypothetical protein